MGKLMNVDPEAIQNLKVMPLAELYDYLADKDNWYSDLEPNPVTTEPNLFWVAEGAYDIFQLGMKERCLEFLQLIIKKIGKYQFQDECTRLMSVGRLMGLKRKELQEFANFCSANLALNIKILL